MSLELIDMREIRPISAPLTKKRPPGPQTGGRRSRFDVPGWNPYCTSNRCCSEMTQTPKGFPTVMRKRDRVVKHDIKDGTRECPDCHGALLWKMVK